MANKTTLINDLPFGRKLIARWGRFCPYKLRLSWLLMKWIRTMLLPRCVAYGIWFTTWLGNSRMLAKWRCVMPNQPQVYEIFDVVRRSDGMVMNHISSGNRYMVYTLNGLVSVRTLMADEIVGTPKLFELILERAGYRVTPVKKD